MKNETMEKNDKPLFDSREAFPESKILNEGESITGDYVTITESKNHGSFLVLESDGKKYSISCPSLLKKLLADATAQLKDLSGHTLQVTYLGEKKLEEGKWKGQKAKIHELKVF